MGCSSLEAVNRIYEIKGRKHMSPLAICVGDVTDIERFVVTGHLPHGLLESLLPGPVILVLRRGDSSLLDKSLHPGLETIRVQVPDSNFTRDVARGLETALALTSANLSGLLSSVCIKDFENLWEHCAYVYSSGVLPSSLAGSTVVDLRGIGKFKILRLGRFKLVTSRLAWLIMTTSIVTCLLFLLISRGAARSIPPSSAIRLVHSLQLWFYILSVGCVIITH